MKNVFVLGLLFSSVLLAGDDWGEPSKDPKYPASEGWFFGKDGIFRRIRPNSLYKTSITAKPKEQPIAEPKVATSANKSAPKPLSEEWYKQKAAEYQKRKHAEEMDLNARAAKDPVVRMARELKKRLDAAQDPWDKLPAMPGPQTGRFGKNPYQ